MLPSVLTVARRTNRSTAGGTIPASVQSGSSSRWNSRPRLAATRAPPHRLSLSILPRRRHPLHSPTASTSSINKAMVLDAATNDSDSEYEVIATKARLASESANRAGTDTELWNTDTGATASMTPHRHWLRNMVPHRVPIRVATNEVVYSEGLGEALFIPVVDGVEAPACNSISCHVCACSIKQSTRCHSHVPSAWN